MLQTSGLVRIRKKKSIEILFTQISECKKMGLNQFLFGSAVGNLKSLINTQKTERSASNSKISSYILGKFA